MKWVWGTKVSWKNLRKLKSKTTNKRRKVPMKERSKLESIESAVLQLWRESSFTLRSIKTLPLARNFISCLTLALPNVRILIAGRIIPSRRKHLTSMVVISMLSIIHSNTITSKDMLKWKWDSVLRLIRTHLIKFRGWKMDKIKVCTLIAYVRNVEKLS
jgi:hypothetical protein